MFTRNRRTWIFPTLALVALAACSDDDDDDGNGGPDLQDHFSATLDETQQTPAPVAGTRVRVTVTNRAPALGTSHSRVWFGFHDGTFDGFDAGAAAPSALESLAEDGDAEALETDFDAAAVGDASGTLEGELGAEAGVLAPGETLSRVFEFDSGSSRNRFFSYTAAIVPSNDAFVANDDPLAHPVFDVAGNFVAADFVVLGTAALDAGTEVNDEQTATTNGFGQTLPNSGVIEGGVVAAHPGYLAVGTGGILDDPAFADADFTAVGYEFLSFTFEELPAAPAATGLAIVGLSSSGTQVDYRVTATGLSGEVTEAHFHSGAPGVAGPVQVDITDDISTNEDGVVVIEGSSTSIPDVFRDALRAGDAYVDLHTTLNPNGELRGQVLIDEAFTATLTTGDEVPAPVTGVDVRVTARNLAPDLGTRQSPVWVAFHDGTFDPFDAGTAASADLERLAEDGDLAPLGAAFEASGAGTISGVLSGSLGTSIGEVSPGEAVTRLFRVDPSALSSGFFSYASMVLPSNDAFVANDDPLAHPVFDAGQTFLAVDFTVPGSAVLDAGTEVNDEVPANTAFFGQTVPNTGTAEGGTIAVHGGFLPAGSGGILDDPQFTDADFTAVGYETLRFSFDTSTPATSASGAVVASLNALETEITFTVFASDLSGPATDMHFHEAPPGVAGPVVMGIFDTVETNEDGILTASGTKAVTPTFVTALRAGDIYLNIHTALNPSGEIRGQLDVVDVVVPIVAE